MYDALNYGEGIGKWNEVRMGRLELQEDEQHNGKA